MPRRTFMPPAYCDRCGVQPPLGETLFHYDGWLCANCLGKESPGRDATSKSAFFACTAQSNRTLARQCQANGQEETADEYERIGHWHNHAADLLHQAANNRAQAAQVALGEVVPEQSSDLKDTLSIPDCAALDASVERTRLLMADGVDCLSLALDAAHSGEAKTSIEKMHLHQLAVLHKTALEQIRRASHTADHDQQTKQFQIANRFIRTFQQGIIALMRLRGGGSPIIQHVHLADGAQAVVGAVQNGKRSG
ncbi:MAG: hypothetical protein O3A59_11610 [Nitrospirae bacterium]|nr:hypothetical protein [Nitrospirota bacterium]